MCRAIVEGKEDQVKRLGKFLVDKTASYPDFVEEIVASNPNISYEWLLLVRKVGYGYVHAPLVQHYRTPGVRRISRFEIGKQIKLWNEGVIVVSRAKNGFVEKRKSICNLSFLETCRVFTKKLGEVRSVDAQIEHIKTVKVDLNQKYSIRKNGVAMLRKCVLNRKEVAEIARGVLTQNEIIALLSKNKRTAA
jgi:hypothetical protein